MSVEEDWGQVHVTRKCCGAANCRNFAPEIFGEAASPTRFAIAMTLKL